MTVWVGRYAMVGGQVREHGPWLVDRVRRRDEETLRVLVLAEPVDARSTEFCHEVAEAVAALFARESLSITGGLLRALRQAHANLAEWNRRSLREHRVAVGVTCVVVRDQEVLVAQSGPGVAYMRQGQQIIRLTTDGLPGATPLGADQPIEPLFTSGMLADGQVLLLSGNAERALGRHTIEAALAAGPEEALAQIFPHTRTLADMTAVLVADLDIEEEQIAAPLDVDGAPGALGYDEDLSDYEGREIAFTGHDGGRPAPPPVKRPRGWKLLTTDTLGVGDGDAARAGGRGAGRMPSIRRTRAVGHRAGQTPLVPWRTAGLIVVVALVLALLAYLVLPGLLSEDRAAELETAITAANAQLASAEAADNPEATREALRNALAQAELARGLAPDDPRIAQIVADAEARLQSLDAITNVAALVPILTFEGSITAPVQPEALISGGASLWLRESGRGRVIRIDPRPEAEPREVFRAGETYDGVEAREPLAMAWDASTSRLLLIDAGRTLFAIADADGAAPVVLPLRDAAEMRSVAALVVYLGNLYVLDPDGGEVWRYLPAGDGFDSERTGILGGQDLAGASGLAIDGEVFVLDGPVLRHFVQGREQTPLLQGIDEPPQSATGLAEDVLREVIYLADRGNGRIVAGDRDGAFLRQYRHPDFIDLRGVAIAPDGTALFALTGNGIASFTLQPAQ